MMLTMRIFCLLLLVFSESLEQDAAKKDGVNDGSANGRDKEGDVNGPRSLPPAFHSHGQQSPTGVQPQEPAKRDSHSAGDDDKFAHEQFFGEMATFNVGAFGMFGLMQEKEKEANGSKSRAPEAPPSSAAPPPEIETFFWTVPMERSEARPNHVEDEAPQRSRSEAEDEQMQRSRLREAAGEDTQRYNAAGRWNGPYRSREFARDRTSEFEEPHPEREWQPEPPRREWSRPHQPTQRGRWDRPSSSANGRWYEDGERRDSAPVKRRAAPPQEDPWSDAKSRMPQPEAFGEPSYFEEVLEQGEDPTAVRLRDEDVVGWDD